MIKKIIDADDQAQKLEEANKRAGEEEKKRIEQETAEIYQKYMDDAQAKIQKINDNMEKKAAQSKADILAKQESVLIKLKSDYEQNRDKWVDDIVSRVLN